MIYEMRPPGSPLAMGLAHFVATLSDGLVMAEIGCYRGESTRIFLRRCHRIYCVDPWQDFLEERSNTFIAEGVELSPFTKDIKLEDMSVVEHIFDETVAYRNEKVIKVKTTSEAAVVFNLVPDGLDLVYIDAEHSYESVQQDIKLWLPKIKATGIISGHDYSDERPGVKRAVHEAFGKPHRVFIDGTWMVRKAVCQMIL